MMLTGVNAMSRRNRIRVPCDWCGEEIERRPSDLRRGKAYCSAGCSNKGRSRSISEAMKGHPVAIENGKKNYVYLERYYQKGNKPWNYSQIGKGLICRECGGMFDVHPHKVKDGKGKYCSLECYRQAIKNPERSDEIRERTSPAMKQWKIKVFEHDRYTCQKCGLASFGGVYLEAHHIKSFRDYPKLRLDVDNGLTLCAACHYELHHSRKKTFGECLDCGGRCGQRSQRCRKCEDIRKRERAKQWDVLQAQIIKLYKGGYSARAVGEIVNRDHKSVLRTLKRRGIKSRSKSQATRLYYGRRNDGQQNRKATQS